MLTVRPHRIFSDGPDGHLHAIAHRSLKTGRLDEGRRALAHWATLGTEPNSRTAHLHWHQLVFDLALGDRFTALRRYNRHIRPAMLRGLADTDGPQALWRLSLAGVDPGRQYWLEARWTASTVVARPASPWTRLHAALAFAGAADAASLRHMISAPATSEEEDVLHEAIAGLEELVTTGSVERFAAVAGDIPALGGSEAQNALFTAIVDDARTRSHALVA